MRTVLRRPDFRLLFGGLLASMAAESILLLALAIWVKDLTGSTALAGATIFAVIAPMTWPRWSAGSSTATRVDRSSWSRTWLTALCSAPLFAVRDAGDVWIVYVVAALYGLSSITLGAALSGLHPRDWCRSNCWPTRTACCRPYGRGCDWSARWPGAALYAALGGWALAGIGMVGFLTAAAVVTALPSSQQAATGRRGCGGRPNWAPACGTWPASRPCGGPCSATGSGHW